MPACASAGVPACSDTTAIGSNTSSMHPITPYSTQACRRLPIISPKHTTMAAGSRAISTVSTRLVSGVGFSNGCAELALKKPPPLVPRCLMVSSAATGPVAMVWPPPCIGCAVMLAASVCGEPCQIMNTAISSETGSSTRVVKRIRSR